MRAMLLRSIAPLEQNAAPLELADLHRPQPLHGQVLVEIATCGVCHTELDEIEGRTPPASLPVVPGHQVIGRVVESGPGCSKYAIGDRVGIGWIYASDGSPTENLSAAFTATGRDVDGGYAEFIAVNERYAYPIPDAFDDVAAAPLLCAGGVGYRALRLARLENGQTLGLTGFGGSGHLVLQLVKHLYPASAVLVFARSPVEREFAASLGADWCGDTDAAPPESPHAVIDTTPAWRPLLAALRCLRPGGRLVINAIRKERHDVQALTAIRYEDHLWLEKEIKTVANVTHQDIAEFLPIAASIPIRVETQTYPLEKANEALCELHKGHVRGSKVLVIKQ